MWNNHHFEIHMESVHVTYIQYNVEYYTNDTWFMLLEHIISNDGQSFYELIWPSLCVIY